MKNKNNQLQHELTQESLFFALLILLKAQSYNTISITSLCKKAGVSRMAFYRHYTSMEDIIYEHLKRRLQEYTKKISIAESADIYQMAYLYFECFRAQKELIDLLVKNNLCELIRKSSMDVFNLFCKDMTCSRPCTPKDKAYEAEFIVGGLYQVLFFWNRSGMQESCAEMAKLTAGFLHSN